MISSVLIPQPIVVSLSSKWEFPLPKYKKRAFQTASVSGLKANTLYRVTFERAIINTGGWKGVEDAWFTTLPKTLPKKGEGEFRVMVGSCFYEHKDDGKAALAYKKIWENPSERPHAKFLVGDQVYLDINRPYERLKTVDLREHVLGRYAESWRELGSMLKRSGTWMLSDDHEFYNDFPFSGGLFPPSPDALARSSGYRSTWKKITINAVERIQQTSLVRFFDVEPLSFCILDTRTRRSRAKSQGFVPMPDFAKVLQWLGNLKGPGVLVLSQLLMAGLGSKVLGRFVDHNLAWYTHQYQALVKAIAGCGHDVVVLTGDVHFGRVSTATFSTGNKLIEVISSPMSNLTMHNSVSTNEGNSSPALFPLVPVQGVAPVPVKHEGRVSSRGAAPPTYLKRRTREHFVTVGFSQDTQNVRMRVKAWRIRSNANNRSLPKLDYTPLDYILT